MTMTQEEEKPYNQVPRYIASDFRAGRISRNALFIYLWLRTNADPYGVVTTSSENLRADLFPELKKNTVNKALIELRGKQYIYYELRQGKTGSFDVHFGDWRLPKGKGYKTLEKYFANGQPEKKQHPQADPSEINQKLEGQNQKLIDAKRQLTQRFSPDSELQQFRSYQNENENEKEIENHGSTLPIKARTLVRDFQPKTREESLCKEIAKEVGDEYINPLLSVIRTHEQRGAIALEKAVGIFREDIMSGKQIRSSRAAYFYGIVKKILADDG